jgi:hypothetical protein
VSSEAWECAACGRTATQVARVFCTICSGHHEVCLDCAPDAMVDGQWLPIREIIRGLLDEGHGGAARGRLLIATAGDMAVPHVAGPR